MTNSRHLCDVRNRPKRDQEHAEQIGAFDVDSHVFHTLSGLARTHRAWAAVQAYALYALMDRARPGGLLAPTGRWAPTVGWRERPAQCGFSAPSRSPPELSAAIASSRGSADS